MASPKSSLPLYEKVYHRNTIHRALDVIILLLLLCLLFCRILYFKNHGFAWLLAFLCESCFTLVWILIVNCKWTPLTYKTYPQRLQQLVQELPPVDMFVTTADAELEPPIITVNTVLSLLAVEYPAHKLACYVSDDACSPLIFYSLVQASKFAKLWVPFCKKFNVQTRAPARYFLSESTPPTASSWDFQQHWKKIKEEYDQLTQNIQHATNKLASVDLTDNLAVFSDIELKNHSTIIKVIWENKKGFSNEIPHLIYISREKRPKHQHHYKAGAMNVLTRVSGLMTNAPYMLNVDCDMYANNPEIVLQAMCLLQGSDNERDYAFVQSPQLFYDNPEHPLAMMHEYIGKGAVGIQGPFYQGSGAFHTRKVMYGEGPDEIEDQVKVSDNELQEKFGNSKEFIESAAHALEGKTYFPSNLSNCLDAAHRVAGCGYEYGSSWGKKVGWIYGSATEDILTGLLIHSKGWRSGYCLPDPPAFLGCGPPSVPSGMIQQKRWAMGLLEILFSNNNPILATLSGKLQFRQCLAYLWVLTWGLRSIPELCYAALPAYCIITNSSFLPKVQELGICIPVALIVLYNLYTLSEYISAGFSIFSWWLNNCMARIVSMSAWLFGFVYAVLKVFGLSETTFEITQKPHQSSTSSDGGKEDNEAMFDESPYFIPGTTILLVHLATLTTGLLGMQQGSGVGEYICSVFVVLCFLPFLQGLFRTGKYGIPWSTICKSATLALLFMQSCKMINSRN